MEADNRLPSGEWNGFYLEKHQPKKGWMHLFMTFEEGEIKAEGTDYVGPWVAQGKYDLETGDCRWVKQYLKKHQVHYSGTVSANGIMGRWTIPPLSGEFHIWPKSMTELNEMYLTQDMNEPSPSMQLGTVPVDDPFRSV